MESSSNYLNEIANIIDSLHKTPVYSSNGHPMVRVTDVKYGSLDLTAAYKVDDQTFAEFSRRYTPKRGDIIITRVGSYGHTALVEETGFCLGQNTAAIIPQGINHRYLYFVLNSSYVKRQIESLVVGSTQKTLSLKAIGRIEIPRFPERIERKIAEVGGTIDDKIDVNCAVNNTLEQIAQALFKSWFVDFEPVKAKIAALESGGTAKDAERAAMQTISGKSEDELDTLATQNPDQYDNLALTAALFPSATVESELGEIPEGWGLQSVEDVLELRYGKALKRSDRVEGDFPVYGSGGISGMHNQALVEGPGIVVGRKGTVGSVYWEDRDFYPIDTAYYVVPKAGFSMTIAFYLLQSLPLDSMNTDAAVPGLNRKNVYRLGVPAFPEPLMERFDQFIGGISKMIATKTRESETLSEMRDALLPKLLSGELAVPEAEEQIPEAADV